MSNTTIKQGYKQTEVGLIPEDWKIRTLREVGDAKMCKRIFSYQTSEKGDIPFYKIGTFGKEPDAYISKEIYNEYKKKFSYPKKETILISAAGTVGRTVVFNGEDSYFQDSNIVWIDNDEKILTNEYLKHTFPKIRFRTEGGTIQRLYNNILLSGYFPLPPTLEEQKAIATALSDVDELISNLDKLITKKKAIKQGAMQQLLTPKENWTFTSLIELAENKKSNFNDGDWIESDFIIESGIRLIQTGNIGIGKFIEKGSKKYISEESFFKLRCKEVLKGDLLICRLAEPAGRACVMPNIGESKVITSVDVSIFRGDDKIVNREFLSQYFTTGKWFNQVLERVGGTTHKRISRGALGKLEFFLPNIKEQKTIAQILADMDLEIEKLETKKAKYQSVKQGMMQELLTGKTRLV